MHRSARTLTAEARRLLDMLAAWPEGVPEPVLRAHGFNTKLIAALMAAGLGTGSMETAVVGKRDALIRRVTINHAGRLARHSAAKRSELRRGLP
jgi:hypothetical protein